MKSVLFSLCLVFLFYYSGKAVNLPAELKGNWLNAHDSICWEVSFQPGFVMYNYQFWEYLSMEGNSGRYRLELSNGKTKLDMTVRLEGQDNLIFNAGGTGDIRCIRRKAVNPDFRNYDTLGFPENLIVDDTVTIRGFIEDYDPEIFETAGHCIIYSVFTGLKNEAEIDFPVEKDGRFEVKFRAFYPHYIFLDIEGSTFTRIFVVPGQQYALAFNKKLSEVTVDKKKWEIYTDWDINHYMGKSGLLSEELLVLYYYYNTTLRNSLLQKRANMYIMSQMEYLQWRKKIYNHECRQIDSLLTSLRCSKKAWQFMQHSLQMDLMKDLYRYPVEPNQLQFLCSEYIKGLPSMPESDLNLICDNFISLINYHLFFSRFQPLSITSGEIKKIYLSEMLNLSNDSTERDTIRILINRTDNISDELDAFNAFPPDSAQFDRYFNKKITEMYRPYDRLCAKYNKYLSSNSINTKANIEELNSVMQKHRANINGQSYALYVIGDMKEKYYPGQVQEIMKWAEINIKNQVFKKYLWEDHKKRVEASADVSYAENTFFIDQIKSSGASPDQFLEEILEKFKGKVIYIDFWANWCSPCRAGFKPAARLKKELSGKDVVFLYFGVNSTKENWDRVIRQDKVSGYHYWLDENQDNILKKRFGFNSIPYYLLVDKSGNIQQGEAPTPHDRIALLEKINELMNK